MTGPFDGLAGNYGVILADPPWAFRTFSGANATPHRCAEDHYQTLDFAALRALPVADIAAPNCALFMWVVGSHLDEALELARAWDFSFCTDAFYWLKQKMIGADQIDIFTGDIPPPKISMGYRTRKQVEPCWMFTRGKVPRGAKDVRQLIIEPPREHSRKPEAQYDRIERLVPDVPRLEMFARTRRPGWDAWGNQVERFAGQGVAA